MYFVLFFNLCVFALVCVCVIMMMLIQMAGERSRKEVEGLQKKLRWYAENQELLDKDAARLRQKDAEISQLADKLQQLKTEVSENYRFCSQELISRSASSRDLNLWSRALIYNHPTKDRERGRQRERYDTIDDLH